MSSFDAHFSDLGFGRHLLLLLLGSIIGDGLNLGDKFVGQFQKSPAQTPDVCAKGLAFGVVLGVVELHVEIAQLTGEYQSSLNRYVDK